MRGGRPDSNDSGPPQVLGWLYVRTASVFINDDECGLHQDYDDWLEELAPHEPVSKYRHNRTGEDNADAHMKRRIMGREVVVAITDGRLDFGPWEQIFCGEFDGRRWTMFSLSTRSQHRRVIWLRTVWPCRGNQLR
jgi:secondary thiamine-phosphate synthase enzyme